MDRETFIIAVYCVAEHYHALTAHRPLRRGGFAPALSEEEVLTMEICGAYFKLPSDRDMGQDFRTHYPISFQRWETGRSVYANQRISGSA